jgi:cell division protein FtsW
VRTVRLAAAGAVAPVGLRIARIGGLALAASALALLCALQLLALMRAPAAFSPARIEVRLRPGEALTLGRHELAAPQAERSHLALRRDAQGRWWAGNDGAVRPVQLLADDADRRTGSMPLAAGQRFQLGPVLFEVQRAGRADLAFSGAGRQWRYDGATLMRDSRPQPACSDARAGARALALWNRWMPRGLTVPQSLAFGGNLHCGSRIGIAGVAPASAGIARGDGEMMLSAGAGPGRSPLLFWSEHAAPFDLTRQELALEGVRALVVGRTRLQVEVDGAALRLRPVSHVALSGEARVELPPHVSWRWRQRDLWELPPPAGWLLVLALAGAVGLASAGLACGTLGRVGTRAHAFPVKQTAAWAQCAHPTAGILLALAGLTALLLQRAGSAPGAAISLLLAWAALWYALLAPGRTSLVTVSGVLLLAVGLLAQLEIGFGAAESSWPRHFQKTAALLAIGLGATGLLRLRRARAPLQQAQLEWLLVLMALAALAALLLQVAFGDETGVFDLQPVEFAKLALTALTAHCIALGLGSATGTAASEGALRRWLRIITPVLLFVALLGVALVQVDDYSPLILLLVWSLAMALAWALAARKALAVATLAAVVLGVVLAVVGLRAAGVDQVAGWRFYGDRFLVWLDPATHPHTGQQLLLAGRAIADGGWFGADRLLGISTLGQDAGGVLRIPAVQDDFAPSFFLNRHGLASALALWCLQVLFLFALLRSALRAWLAAEAAGDFRQAWRARFRCFALSGGGAFVFGHFLLSWGTNLAIFPVMGQPMSFLSAGGSHLLFFICPLLALGVASTQSFEES